MLYTGGWDRQLRCIDLEKSIVDQSFTASRDAIRTLHLFGRLLFVAGQDPTIRAYDLETGQIKEYKDQHTSWVLCL
jgi:WD40 repeat protein